MEKAKQKSVDLELPLSNEGLQAEQIPGLVEWHDGMILTPELFHLSSMRQEHLLQFRSATTTSYFWGVHPRCLLKGRIQYDVAQLANGIFYLNQLEAILPDGLVTSFPDAEGNALSIDLQTATETNSDELLTVFVAVSTKKGYQRSEQNQLQRYRSVELDPFSDQSQDEEGFLIPFLLPEVHLQVTPRLAPQYVGFPIAQIKNDNGNFTVTDFIPPILGLTPEHDLYSMTAEITRLLREKNQILREKLDAPQSMSIRQFFETKDQARSLAMALPSVETVLHSRFPHPFALFTQLMLVVGNLSWMSSLSKGTFPYQHHHLRTSFQKVKDYIFKTLEQQVSRAYRGIVFVKEEQTFKLRLEDTYFFQDYQIEEGSTEEFLIVVDYPANGQRAETLEWMQNALIASKSQMPQIQMNRTLGVDRFEKDGVEQFYPPKDTILFSVIATPHLVLPNEELCIQNLITSQIGQPKKITLYRKVIRGSQ